jgi:hypothetical protein
MHGREPLCASRKKTQLTQLVMSVSHCYPILVTLKFPPIPEPDPPHPATTPWIALVACDANATHASQDVDVFTLANGRGAVGAVRIISLCKRWARYLTELASLLGMVKRMYYQSRVQGHRCFHTANGYLFYTIPGIRTGYS